MPGEELQEPRHYLGVMVSSTFRDLKAHRASLIQAIKAHGFTDVAMENDASKPDLDVIDSSLKMVRDASAYIGMISRKYGQTPRCLQRNPTELSLTELEFDEAQRLERPILLFIMGKKHPVLEEDVELDPDKRKKLEAFRERAKQKRADSPVHRVYATFESLEEFKEKVGPSLAALSRFLEARAAESAAKTKAALLPAEATVRATKREEHERDAVPKPPAFYAEPPYIGSHEFLGRRAELETLSDWVDAADPHPVLLYEAIGGAGKSMLTWHFTTTLAASERPDWAGRFWYSFYERGAIMADFCRRALAYVTGRPFEEFRKQKTTELGEPLLKELRARPWLFVLDGLERVLVAYHRFDAAQIADEEAGTSDAIAKRDPCSAIRPEDDDLLRALAAAAPSKLLVTSRLIPRVLVNASGQPIAGVRRESLSGLRAVDAEALFRACGVHGTSSEIQTFLKTHCDCHPLVTGVLAGLVNDHLPDRGNFDAWVADPTGGSSLNLAALDLVQKRNHILQKGFAALDEKSRALLSTLALVSEEVDYETLNALNPHIPSKSGNAEERSRPDSAATREELKKTVRDLERRGLLQYDAHAKRYDLHPVVRGVAAGDLRQEETVEYGQRLVDHFSAQPHRPYEQAETLDDVRSGLHVVRTLVRMERFEQASSAFRGGVGPALLFNLEAYAEVLSLLRPFFAGGWAKLPTKVGREEATYLAGEAGLALGGVGAKESLEATGVALLGDLEQENWLGVRTSLTNLSILLVRQNRFAKAERCRLAAFDVAALLGSEDLFMARLGQFKLLAQLGRNQEAEAMWRLLNPMGRQWTRDAYRPGDAERLYAQVCFFRGELSEKTLARAENLARAGMNRFGTRDLHKLRGEWRLERREWSLAAESLRDAVRMAREIGQVDIESETRLALASFHLGEALDARRVAEELEGGRTPDSLDLARLWHALGDRERAKKRALSAYGYYWADGEPYVYRYYLEKSRALLEELGVEIPDLPSYDRDKDEKLPWEDAVAAAIQNLKAESETKEQKKKTRS